DLGAVFDTLNLRSPGVDMLSGFNVHTIALEIPISMVTQDGKGASDTATPSIGAYASTARRTVSVLRPEHDAVHSGRFVQVQRLASPLVNEAIIGTNDKDRWNMQEPQTEGQFEDYYTNLRLDAALQAATGLPATPLLDVRDLLLKYQADGKPCAQSQCSE